MGTPAMGTPATHPQTATVYCVTIHTTIAPWTPATHASLKDLNDIQSCSASLKPAILQPIPIMC
jgi:hypothetical protein